MDGQALEALVEFKQALLQTERYEHLHELQHIEKSVAYDIPFTIE
jgi:hypothetical protein